MVHNALSVNQVCRKYMLKHELIKVYYKKCIYMTESKSIERRKQRQRKSDAKWEKKKVFKFIILYAPNCFDVTKINCKWEIKTVAVNKSKCGVVLLSSVDLTVNENEFHRAVTGWSARYTAVGHNSFFLMLLVVVVHTSSSHLCPATSRPHRPHTTHRRPDPLICNHP